MCHAERCGINRWMRRSRSTSPTVVRQSAIPVWIASQPRVQHRSHPKDIIRASVIQPATNLRANHSVQKHDVIVSGARASENRNVCVSSVPISQIAVRYSAYANVLNTHKKGSACVLATNSKGPQQMLEPEKNLLSLFVHKTK